MDTYSNKCCRQQEEPSVFWYMVASWACEVTEILSQRCTEEASFV